MVPGLSLSYVTTVVVLHEQIRVSDPTWHCFLQHLRQGAVQPNDIKILRSLLLTNPECPATDFSQSPWSEASLVTPRHAVRTEWNLLAIEKLCKQTQQQMFLCTAEDTIRNRALSPEEQYAVIMQTSGQGRRHRRSELPKTVHLSIGMRVMVTQNVQTDLDITNGARGSIENIILHPNEPPLPDDSVVELQHLPLYVLVKLDRTRTTRLHGLAPSVIPIEPSSKSFLVTVTTEGNNQRRTVRRRQFPITAAYAFTDYRSQGQTLANVLVDIASPPSGGLSLFNLYVALSRSSGRSSIRLLRPFEDKIFAASHEPELLAEDDRLDLLDHATKRWWSEMRSDSSRM